MNSEQLDAIKNVHRDGKIAISLRYPITDAADLARVYTPGVAQMCTAIHEDESLAREFTVKKNSVAVVTDGSAVLGLGDIGPKAALPVMEGKAALFKRFAGVDAWPICLDTQDVDEIVQTVKAIAPGFGGINLEDISAPRCFEIERRLRAELDIPVFHDDQYGTAVVVLAALYNSLQIVRKNIQDIRVVVSGVGAAGTAIIKLLMHAGVRDIIGCGRQGAIGRFRTEKGTDRQWLAQHTNLRNVQGSVQEVLAGADVFIGVSSGNLLQLADITQMAEHAIVFALANPTPEIDPLDAWKEAAIVATGRSDYPNQINNVLVFPGLFRGLLDAGAKEITIDILSAAAHAIANIVPVQEVRPRHVIPEVFDLHVAEAVANAVVKAHDKAVSEV
ncbi:NADP-dependent malic enzyme [uncultured Arcanobacterium sp.]|uniref:NAD(P)-dependent malic enzyme n=1 Tax=uncultured Arcanobacterium sp. TaxID=487520 RepID=UPI00262AA871|nr:NADP-dependent malic enzyme [uncultured Arcanobacterium sp.]